MQVDGSEHWWLFEDRGPQWTLLVFADLAELPGPIVPRWTTRFMPVSPVSENARYPAAIRRN